MYALKAGDAETIGGLPPSAFVLAAPSASGSATASSPAANTAGSRDMTPTTATDVTTTGGTANYLPIFTGASTILDSVVYQSGTGSTAKVGINTSTPASTLDVKGAGTIRGPLTLPTTGAATATASYNSEPLNLSASVFNSGTGTAAAQTFQLKAEPVRNDMATASGVLSLLYASGSNAPGETGLQIASNGVISFATGQTFPGGGGTITGVTAGTDLTGGGTTGTVTLNLDTTKVPQLAAANTFTASQIVSGSLTATSFSGNGSALTSLQGANVQGAVATAGNALNLGGFAPSAYQPAGSYATTGSNTFTGTQSVTGNVAATGSVSGAAATFTGLVTEAGALLPASGTATTAQGYSSQPLDSVTSAYNSSTASAQSQDFRWLAEPVGNDTSSPSGKLDLLFGTNGAAPAETGLSVASNGVISFASGQTFPGGGGTITGVTAGTDLTGGGTTGTVTLNLDTTKVPQLAAANTFTASQIVSGSLTATSFSGNGSALTSLQGANVQGAVATAGNALNLGGFAPSAYQPAGSYATTGSNTFTGTQSVTGNVAATGSVSGAAATFTGLVTEAGALLPASGAATTAQGYSSQPLDSVTSAYNSSTASAQSQDFRWLAEPVGNDTSSPSGKLDLLFGTNGATPAETGLSVASNGVISFASGQTFPGAGSGTVTSVGSGAGLTGGPITTSGSLGIATGGVSNAMLANPSVTVSAGTDLTGGGLVALGGSTTLNLDTTKVPQLNASNTFGAGQTVNGTLTGTQFVSIVAPGSAPLVVSSTTQVNNLNASFLGGYSAGSFQPAGSYATLGSNTFSATQSISSGDLSVGNGNVDLPSTASSGTGIIKIGSSSFVHACCDPSDVFVGTNAGSLNAANTGTQNVGVGIGALAFNTTGQTNTAVGSGAMQDNTSGSYNTAIGWDALIANGTASNNTAIGANALGNNGSGADNTATGRQALSQNTSGTSNTAIGFLALNGNTMGNNNTAIGYAAGENITTTSNNIDINNNGVVAGDNGVIRIGTSGGAQTQT